MKGKLFLFFIVCSVSSSAMAQNDATLCKLREAEKPQAAIGAVYQPGVDVHGNAVMPADINAAVPLVPDVVRIPLSVDLAQKLGVALPAGTELKTELGIIEVYKDGRVSINGSDYTQKTVALCGDVPPPQEVIPASGQPEEINTSPLLTKKTEEATEKVEEVAEEEIIWGEGY